MNRLCFAFSLYAGLISFFAVNAVALLYGASMATAVLRGLVALALFAGLGLVASLALRVKPSPARSDE